MNHKQHVIKRSYNSIDLTKEAQLQKEAREKAERKRRAYEALPAIADAAWGRTTQPSRVETNLYTVTISGSRSQIISLPLSAFLTSQTTEEEKSVGK